MWSNIILYYVYNISLIPVCSQKNPFHRLLFCFFTASFNMQPHLRLGLPSDLSFRFLYQTPIHKTFLSHNNYMPHSRLSRLFDHHTVILREVTNLKLLFMEAFSPLISSLKDTVFFPAFCLWHCSLNFFPHCDWQNFAPVQNSNKIIVSVTL